MKNFTPLLIFLAALLLATSLLADPPASSSIPSSISTNSNGILITWSVAKETNDDNPKNYTASVIIQNTTDHSVENWFLSIEIKDIAVTAEHSVHISEPLSGYVPDHLYIFNMSLDNPENTIASGESFSFCYTAERASQDINIPTGLSISFSPPFVGGAGHPTDTPTSFSETRVSLF